jgi:hypothetical protein
MSFFTTEDLVESIKRRTLAPTSQKTFEAADIVDIANEVLHLALVPAIMKVREDNFLKEKQVSLVSGVKEYLIPERAIGNAFKDIFFVKDGQHKELTRADTTHLPEYSGMTGDPVKFLLKGNAVRMLPVPDSGAAQGVLEFWIHQRRNDLVQTSAVAKITDVSSAAGTTTFTVDTDLTAALSVGSDVDFLAAKSPFDLWAQDVDITAITANTIAVATADIDNEASSVLPQVGDYICPAKTANIPQVAQEFHPILAELSARVIIQALGHRDKLQEIKENIAKMEKDALVLISNRVENQVEFIKSRSGLHAYSGGGIGS